MDEAPTRKIVSLLGLKSEVVTCLCSVFVIFLDVLFFPLYHFNVIIYPS